MSEFYSDIRLKIQANDIDDAIIKLNDLEKQIQNNIDIKSESMKLNGMALNGAYN